MKNILEGKCHCGNFSIAFHTDKPLSELTPRECSCSFCRKHQASWISDPEGKVHVKYVDPALVSGYRFGTKTADFMVCRECGILLLTTCEINGRLRAVINIRSMQDMHFPVPAVATNFDGEDKEARFARRERTWTGNVIFDF
jgi:hypothetical protein